MSIIKENSYRYDCSSLHVPCVSLNVNLFSCLCACAYCVSDHSINIVFCSCAYLYVYECVLANYGAHVQAHN